MPRQPSVAQAKRGFEEERAQFLGKAHPFLEGVAMGLEPDPDLTVDEWADENMILPATSSAERGLYRTDRTPYMREIMQELSSQSPTEIVVLQAGTQTGKTQAGNNWVGWTIDLSPCPMIIVEPTVQLAEKLSKQRIAPMIESCPTLKDKVRDPRSRHSGNTVFLKEFPNGLLLMTGANSAVGLRQVPAQRLFLDEVDGYPVDIEGEGDPVVLAMKRTNTFKRNRKIYMNSTPTLKDTSRIERAFLRGDQRYFHVPCPS